MRRTELNATGFFRPADRRQAGLRSRSVRRRARRPDQEEQGVLLRRRRDASIRRAARRRARRSPTHGAARGHPDGRRAQSAHRRDLSGRHADPDDRVRAQGAERSAGADQLGHREQPADSPGVHQQHAEGRRQGRHPDQPASVGVRPRRLARRRHLRQPADLRALGRRRQRADLRDATSSSRAA